MAMIESINNAINGVVWGIPMMILILGTGIYVGIRNGFPQFTHFGHAMKNTLGKAFTKQEAKEGSVTPFQAMCTALAASIGTGNIAGVSGAIAIGGPGAVFWMWISALLGMCTKYCEVTLAIRYRERNTAGDWVGGPMYYIKNGLGKNWKWLSMIFAVLAGLACLGIGCMTQINTIASTINSAINSIKPTTDSQQTIIALVVGILVAVVVAFVLLGGISRIGEVCASIVPVMAIVYILMCLIVIVTHLGAIPAMFAAIFKGAFNPASIAGGLAGATIKTAITKGVGRGIFSNEAGLGSAPMAHAAADVDHPTAQGLYGIFEVFMDTIVVCTMTALVVLLGNGVQGIEYGNDIGAQLTINGFNSVLPGSFASIVVAICLFMFAFSTILSWGLYGQRCWEFIGGPKLAKVFLVVFCLFVVIGSSVSLSLAWAVADTLNGLMAIPNLIAILALSPEVIRLTKDYFGKVKAGDDHPVFDYPEAK